MLADVNNDKRMFCEITILNKQVFLTTLFSFLDAISVSVMRIVFLL